MAICAHLFGAHSGVGDWRSQRAKLESSSQLCLASFYLRFVCVCLESKVAFALFASRLRTRNSCHNSRDQKAESKLQFLHSFHHCECRCANANLSSKQSVNAVPLESRAKIATFPLHTSSRVARFCFACTFGALAERVTFAKQSQLPASELQLLIGFAVVNPLDITKFASAKTIQFHFYSFGRQNLMRKQLAMLRAPHCASAGKLVTIACEL